MTEAELYDFLGRSSIDYVRVEHPPVFTCQEAEALVPPLPGVHTKNLFLRDGKGRRHVLVVVDWEHQVDLKALARQVAADKLGMASPERLRQHLGVEPGAVTLLGVANARPGAVEVVIDRGLWELADALQCHPLVNTATLSIPRAGLERFLANLGQVWQLVDVPRRRAT